jgi:hypothetical protein
MKLFYPLHICFCFLLFSQTTQAQSLSEDARTLLSATQTLEASGYDMQDSASLEAFSTLMAILYEYDNPSSPDSFSNTQLGKLPNSYRDNPDLSQILALDSLAFLLDTTHMGFLEQFRGYSDSLRGSPRQKMVQMTRGDYGGSPAEYLSVSRAIQRYSVPPVESIESLEAMASESNQNVKDGIVNTQALIEGLFNFVLKRAQEEVVINFMERFLKQEVVSYEELFPTVVEQFNAPGFSYSHSFIERVREAFYEDMQMLSVRLPTILLKEERFEKIQEDPFIYNLLALYSIAGLAQNGVPLDEIIPITYRNLLENYQQTEKKLNFILADSPVDDPEYLELIDIARSCVNRIKTIYLGLEEGEYEIASGISQIVLEDPTSPIEAPEFDFLLRPAYNLDVIMGSDSAADFRLNLLPYLLGGHLDTAYLLGFRSVGAYDKFFGTERTPEQWRAAGLDISRNLNGNWYGDYSIDMILRSWAYDLSTYRQEYDSWVRSLDPFGEMEKALEKLEIDRSVLMETILATRDFWTSQLEGSQGLAFDMLAAIVSNTFDPTDINNIIAMEAYGEEAFFQSGIKKLLDVEERLIQLNDRIGQANPGLQTGNPLSEYLFGKKSPHPYAAVLAQIDELSYDLKALQSQLTVLDRKLAPREVKILDNARPWLWLTETLTNLLYCLRSSDLDQKWITRAELDSILNTPGLREAYLGLMYQRLSNVQEGSLFSPEGMAQLVQQTVSDLPLVFIPSEPDSLLNVDLDFFFKASFLVGTINRILEIPLVVDPANPDEILPLCERNAFLKGVPDLSTQILDLIYYLNVGDHRHAMSSAIRLFIVMKQFEEGEPTYVFLEEYGFFIADLVDAESPQEIESLLNGIADPPGSSRLKRNKALTVGLNAYLGATFGKETWHFNNLNESFFSPAATMPIGITMSGLLGKNHEKPQSFSIFLSFLDLGSILSYRGDPNAFGADKITFKNMFKPGVQLHWNIRNTPFYLGAGVQTGPVYRELGSDEISLRSTRMFLSFGVDVPLKTFYVK